MRGVVADLGELELAAVEAAIGSTSFKRGCTYANGGRVLKLEWDPQIDTLIGRVVGNGALYDTAANFASGDDGTLAFANGDCTCPVGYNCKHVAAIVIAATAPSGPAARPQHQRNRFAARLEVRQPAIDPAVAHSPSSRPTMSPRSTPPSWERSLRALIGAPATVQTDCPMAITLGLSEAGPNGRGSPQLVARLMRQGARGGWINGSLSWNELEPYRSQVSELRADHLDLARELYSVHSYSVHSRVHGTRGTTTAPRRRSTWPSARTRSCGRCWMMPSGWGWS